MPDDYLLETLAPVCAALDSLGVTYAITGSVASSVHGEPVATQDVNICVRMSPGQATRFATMLPAHFYRSAEDLQEAVRIGGMANIVNMETSFKADISQIPREPFHDQVVARAKRVAYGPGGPAVPVVSPEDVILMKLRWRRDSRSAKLWENALS